LTGLKTSALINDELAEVDLLGEEPFPKACPIESGRMWSLAGEAFALACSEPFELLQAGRWVKFALPLCLLPTCH
jgi:hypothetical protein